MSLRALHLVLLIALALGGSLAYGQGSLRPIPKRPRALADYTPSTLKEIVALDSQAENLNKEDRGRKQTDLLPYRVRVIYTGLSRPIYKRSKDALFRWAQCCAGNPDQFTRPYDTEMRFDENGVAYWLAVRRKSLPDFDKELKEGQPVSLYLIRVVARVMDGNPGSVLLVESFSTSAESRQPPKCPMEPAYLTMEIPPQGFVLLEGEGATGKCNVAHKGFAKLSGKTFALLVHADGPSGSGRYWNVTVGVGKRVERKPTRGFCFMTSTVGWRTLQEFHKPLRWIDDQDGKGRPELIIWNSFPLRGEDSTSADYGLMAWVFQVDAKGRFTIDWMLSRRLAGELAAAYRRPLNRADGQLHQIRQQAAQALESFASGSCKN